MFVQGTHMTQLTDVNTTDLLSAIRLGCHTMSNSFNSDDADIPYGGASVRPAAHLAGSFEAHSPGRHLNALLNAEAIGLEVDEDAIDKHAKATLFSYSQAPLPLQRVGQHTGGQGTPNELNDHNVREGFHALYALALYRNGDQARVLAEASIQTIFDYWVPNEQWDIEPLKKDRPIHLAPEGYSTYIQRLARAIGPLVKYFCATGHGPALQLAVVLKDKAIGEFYCEDGAFSTELFGSHAHSTTCVLSSLAQLADLTQDAVLMHRVKAFYDNGLWDMRDQIGWSIEATDPQSRCGRGEANNTGDIIETALILGRWGYTDYYADAERMLRSHLLPSQLRDVSFIVEPDNPDNLDGKRNVAERLRGSFGFPAQYGHEPAGIWDSEKPRIGFNGDIVGGAVGSLCEAYREVSRFDAAGHWVNMLFDHDTLHLEIHSPYTHPQLAIRVKRPGPLHLRLPPWVNPTALNITGPVGKPHFSNGYLIIAAPAINRWLTFDIPLPVHELTLTWRDKKTHARLRGDEVIAMENFGTDLTFFDPMD